MKIKTLTLLFFAATLCSCEGTPETETDVKGVQFTSSITATTNTKVASDAFEMGDKILVSAFDGSVEYAKNVSYSYNNSLFTSESPILYQDENQALTFLAIYPAINDFSNSFNFEIKADQTVSDNYEMSDLLTSKIEPTNESCPKLSFNHRMSNIIINITSAGVSGGDISIRSKNQVTCDVSGGIFTASGESVTITPVVNGNSGFKAIIAPQTITSGTVFATYIVDNMTYTWKPQTDLVFLSGNQYVYNWNLVEREITLEGIINGWGDGGTESIELE